MEDVPKTEKNGRESIITEVIQETVTELKNIPGRVS
jgi:hypothetical protein